MNEPTFKTAAYAIAETAPRHLDQPTSPPIKWRKEGDDLVVILADGRIATGPIVDKYRDAVVSVKKQSVTVTELPVKVVAPVQAGKPKTSSPKGKTR